MRNKKTKSSLLKVLLIVIILIFILFSYIDILNIDTLISSDILKYISVILCFIITLLIGEDGLDKRDKILLQIGLFITVLADSCFLILNYYILGIALFCLVQITYYNRYRGRTTYSSPFIFVRFTIIFSLIMVTYLVINLNLPGFEFLYAIAFFYAICLIFSVVESIKALKNNLYPYYNKYMIVIGMILFLLCDASIAISNIAGKVSLPICRIFNVLVWTFYLPSQLLLCLSGYRFGGNKKDS